MGAGGAGIDIATRILAGSYGARLVWDDIEVHLRDDWCATLGILAGDMDVWGCGDRCLKVLL